MGRGDVAVRNQIWDDTCFKMKYVLSIVSMMSIVSIMSKTVAG